VAYRLTNKDIYILMNILGAKTLIGLSYPFTEQDPRQFDAEQEITFKKLHHLGLVDLVKGELAFNEEFIQAMWVIAKSNVVVEMVLDESEKTLFYFSDQQVIECARKNEDQFTITILGKPDATWKDIILPRMLKGVENLPVHSSHHLLITPKDYNNYVKTHKIDNLEEIEKNNLLENQSLLVRQFHKAVQRKIHSNRLMMFYQINNQWNVEGIHVLTSPSYNWILRMISHQNEEWLEVKQASGASIVKEIVDVIARVKKEPN
jgi:hypothetical protein